MNIIHHTFDGGSELSEELVDTIIELYGDARPGVVEQLGGRARLLDEIFEGHLLIAFDDDPDGENNNDIVGLASYYYPNNEDFVYLSGLAVAPELRGQREVGPKLLEALADLAMKQGRVAVEGETLPESRGFYSRFGAVNLGSSDRLRVELGPRLSKIASKN